MTREHIQHALDVIYNQIFNQGRTDLLPGLVSGPYIQHNPLFPNGLDGIMAYIKQAGSIPCEVKRIAIDGDMAFIHVRYLNWAGKETAGAGIPVSNPTGNSTTILRGFQMIAKPLCRPDAGAGPIQEIRD